MNFPRAVKYLVAPKEMAELDCWRNGCEEHLAVLGHIKGVGLVLRSLKARVEGGETLSLWEVRDFLDGTDTHRPG